MHGFRVLATALIAVSAIAGSVTAASADVAPNTTYIHKVSVAPTATILGKGLEATLDVVVECSVLDETGLPQYVAYDAYLTYRTANQYAQTLETLETGPLCTGSPQLVTIPFFVGTGQRLIKPSTALVTGKLYSCGFRCVYEAGDLLGPVYVKLKKG